MIITTFLVGCGSKENSQQENMEIQNEVSNNMTDEQSEIMNNLDDEAEAEDEDEDEDEDEMAEVEIEDIPSIGETTVGNIIGIEENTTGEIRILSMTDEELKEIFNYEVYKVTQDYTDEYSITFNYTSDGEIDDLVDYYEQFIINTEGYMKQQPAGIEGASFQGMINGTDIYIMIDNSQGGMTTVEIYLDLTTKK
jgi:hypothetical protein